jgi:DNA invertase Pin-like site-specific DNA recombinase
MMKIDKSNVAKIDTLNRHLSVSNRALYDTLVGAMKKRIAAIKTVALYARVSTKDGRQDTENQLIALREYCTKQSWEIAGEYVDHETGGHSKRPHFQRMFADARARKFDLVLFWSLDRLSREGVSATIGHLERLQDAGVQWRSFTEEYLDSTGLFRDAVIAILAVIAKQERIRRSERASAAIARLRRQGKTDHLGRKRKLVGAKLETARQLHEEGLSLRKIAAKLHVGPMTVQRVLRAV